MGPTPGKIRILVADDEMSIRLGCEKILQSEGFEVVTVDNGLKALESFDEKPFDLVLLDLMMPGMNGLAVLAEIKARDPDVVNIMITGYASFETAVKAIQDGAYDYVPKPFTPGELKIVVRRALERRQLLLRNRRLQEERERTMRDLALEQSRVRSILNAMPEPLLVFNAERELVLFNPAGRVFLKNLTDLIGKKMSEAIILPNLIAAIDEVWQKLSSTVEAVAVEVEDPENKQTWLMNADALSDDKGGKFSEGGNLRGAVVVLSNITPMKDLERAKSRFVSIVAHELKAPVAAIEGYLDLIIGDLDEAMEKFRPKLERCRDRANLLQRLIRELLDISRIEQGRIERTIEMLDPMPIIAEVVEFHKLEADKRGISISIEPPKQPVSIRADRTEVNRIFTNLISNAIKYNKDKGSIVVSCGMHGAFWRCSVTDTGIGIPRNHLVNIGEEFFRVKNSQTVQISGTGLGVSIVKRLLDLNHARLMIASEEGEGSTFTVYWPVDAGAISSKQG